MAGNQYLDAVTSPDVTKVQYELTGGSLNDAVIATGTSTLYGWLAAWDTTTVPVSYTHLDVYKRQASILGTPRTAQVLNSESLGLDDCCLLYTSDARCPNKHVADQSLLMAARTRSTNRAAVREILQSR